MCRALLFAISLHLATEYSAADIGTLISKVEDTRKWDEEGRLNVVVFSLESVEALKVIMVEKTTLDDKKQAFFDFCKTYGHENRTAIIKVVNSIVHHYKGLPALVRQLGHDVLERLGRGALVFDEPSFLKIVDNLARVKNTLPVMQLLGIKAVLDKLVPDVQRLFYCPIKSEQVDDELKTTGVEYLLNLIDFMFSYDDSEESEINEKSEL